MERMVNHDELITLKVLKLIKAESDKFNEANLTPEFVEIKEAA